MILRKRLAVIRDEPNRASGLAGLVLCLWRGHSLRMWAMAVLLFDIDCICEMGSCPWNDFLIRGVTLSMAGNARKGPHCIGIVFLCQKWRLWGLFFAGRNFAAKSMLPPIRKNVFLAAGQSAFLELLALQKGPIAPFSDKSTCHSIRMTFDPHDVRVVRPSIHASLGPYGFLATCRSE